MKPKEFILKIKLSNENEYLGKNKSVNLIKPLISVLVITYQHANYIKDCIEGILMQKTDFPFEVIIGEDESNDGTREICMQYAEKYPDKIRLFLRSRKDVIYINGNPTGKFNGKANLSAARGKYIACCEGDDYWIDPFKLEKQINYMESNLDCSLCCHAARILDVDDPNAELYVRPSNTDKEFSVGEIILGHGGFFPTSSLVYLTDLALKEPDFNENASFGDYPLTIYMASQGKVYYIDDIMSVYRVNVESSWNNRMMRSKKGLDTFEKEYTAVLENINRFTKYQYDSFINKAIEQNKLNVMNAKKLIGSAGELVKDNICTTVSIIIPFFNSKQFLKETIESVFAQTYRYWELLLVDDGSTDGSEQIAMNYANKYPEKVRYLYHEGNKNRGASPSRNLGFNNSKGDIIQYLDSDDVLLPTKLETHVAILKEKPEADAIFGETLFWYSWTGKNNQSKDFIYKPWETHGIQPGIIYKPPHILRLLLLHFMSPCHASLLVRRRVIDLIGGWTEDILNVYEDQAFYVKLFLYTAVVFTYGVQEKYRQHRDSWVSVDEKNGTNLPSRILYQSWAKKYLAEQGFQDEHIENYLNKELMPYENPANNNQIEIPLPVGLKNLGDLHSLSPVSRLWGFDRSKSPFIKGQPVDRYYIEKFLGNHYSDIKGKVLEVGSSDYTKRFGRKHVTQANVIDINANNNQASYIFDLAVGGKEFPNALFDCFILTQTLLFIYDLKSAIKNAYLSLKTGGVLLVTLPGISKIDPNWVNYWHFTDASVRRLFGEIFGEENLLVETYGNVLSATAFLYGLSSQELTNEEIEFKDSDYQVIIAVRAVKPEKAKESMIDTEEEDLARLQAELCEVYNSRVWKTLSSYRRGREKLSKLGSKGKQKMQRFAKPSLRFLKKVWKRLKLRSEANLIRSSEYFDEADYITNNNDVARADVNPAYHYLQFGGFEGRNPSPAFCSTWYLDNNPDVKDAGINPLIHYLKFGKDEGRALVYDNKKESLGG